MFKFVGSKEAYNNSFIDGKPIYDTEFLEGVDNILTAYDRMGV